MTVDAHTVPTAVPATSTERLVVEHLAMARALAKTHRHPGVELDDLTQVACLGLVKAAENFDPTVGEFGPYAAVTVRGELKRYLRDRSWRIRPPRPVQELVLKLREDGYTNGQATTRAEREELGRRHGVDATEVTQALTAGDQQVDSVDRILDAGMDPTTLRTAVRDGFEDLEDHMDLWAALRTLPRRERTIVRQYFFDGLTQQEIADQMGVSQMSVSRWMKRALAMVRSGLEADPGAA